MQPPPKGFPATVSMGLKIAPIAGETGKWTWILSYDGKPRSYELHAIAGKPQNFVIDEKNGILMDATLDNDTLHCVFDVEGTLLITRYTATADTLRYEVRTYKKGGVTTPTGGPNRVTSFLAASVQSAILHRG